MIGKAALKSKTLEVIPNTAQHGRAEHKAPKTKNGFRPILSEAFPNRGARKKAITEWFSRSHQDWYWMQAAAAAAQASPSEGEGREAQSRPPEKAEVHAVGSSGSIAANPTPVRASRGTTLHAPVRRTSETKPGSSSTALFGSPSAGKSSRDSDPVLQLLQLPLRVLRLRVFSLNIAMTLKG